MLRRERPQNLEVAYTGFTVLQSCTNLAIDFINTNGLVQERRNSSALAIELILH